MNLRQNLQFAGISFIIAILTFTGLNSTVRAEGTKDDPKTKLNKLRDEVLVNLKDNLLPYWSSRMIDAENGGFRGRINYNDQIIAGEDKGGILNARILWTFSSAYRIFKDTSYLRIATRAKDYIMKHFIDREYGGAFRSLKVNGTVSDTRKQIYTQTFFIYGLSEYFRATGDKEALTTAKEIFELFEKYGSDKQAGGYFEVFTRDWHRTHDLLIGETSVKDEKTMNTHLHIMEAYSNLFRVWPDARVAACLKDLVEIFLDKITDARTHHLICFMEKDWNRTSDTDSYGHDIEASWLLAEAAGLLGDRDLIARVKETSIKIADAASEGLQSDGSMIYEKEPSSGRTITDRSWWVQAETIVGYLNAWQLTGNARYLDYSIRCWKYTKRHFVDSKAGGWFSSVLASGQVGKADKAGFWVCPYHNGRMCMEVFERVESISSP